MSWRSWAMRARATDPLCDLAHMTLKASAESGQTSGQWRLGRTTDISGLVLP